MITALINGGLASQLNKYIIAYEISKYLNTDLCLNLSSFYSGYFRPYVLCYFNVPECYYVDDIKYKEICRESFSIRNSKDMEFLYKNKNRFNYNIIEEDIYYKDFLIKHPEFDCKVNSQLIKKLELKKKSNFVNAFTNKIKKQDSVAVHIRRGDFVSLNWDDDIEYYKSAIGYMMKQKPNSHFYFFSNDLQWVFRNFGYNDRFHYVMAINGYLGDVEEFICMAKCKYRILSVQSGFGKLANIISCTKYNGEYAICRSENNETRYEQINNTIYYEKNCDSQNKVFLTSEELKEGIKYYDENFKRGVKLKCEKYAFNSISSNDDLDDYLLNCDAINIDEIGELYNKRIELSIKAKAYDKAKDCLETFISIDSRAISSYHNQWQDRYYYIGVSWQRKVKGCVVDVYIGKELWIINGLIRLIMILNRLGCNIVLTNQKSDEKFEVQNIDRQKINVFFIGKLKPNIIISNFKMKKSLANELFNIVCNKVLSIYNYIFIYIFNKYKFRKYNLNNTQNLTSPYSIIDWVDKLSFDKYSNWL